MTPLDAGPHAVHFDPSARYRLDPSVALRPEPFGALAYHFGNRRLTFLKTPALVEVVRALGDASSVTAALDAARIPLASQPAYVAALASLLTSEVLVAI